MEGLGQASLVLGIPKIVVKVIMIVPCGLLQEGLKNIIGLHLQLRLLVLIAFMSGTLVIVIGQQMYRV
jgi:hypothetical protein